MDDSPFPAVLEAVQTEVAALAMWLRDTPARDLAAAETQVASAMRRLGSRVLQAGMAARGTGAPEGGAGCVSGQPRRLEGYRPQGGQTLVGWITLRRAYLPCPQCGARQVPLDAQLGLPRDSHAPGGRRLASPFGALLALAQAARTLDEAAGVRLSASMVRTSTPQIGAAREQAITRSGAAAWSEGWDPGPGRAPPDRCSVAMDGVRSLSTDGQGREVKGGMVVPMHQTAKGEQRGAAHSTASVEGTADFGRRLALLAH